MKHISDLFSRYQKTIKPPQASVEKEFIVVCKETTGISLKPEHCSYTVASKTIYLQAPSIIKSELMRQKPQLLQAIKNKLGTNSPKEIL